MAGGATPHLVGAARNFATSACRGTFSVLSGKHSPKQGGKLFRTESDRATLCLAEVEVKLKFVQSYMFIGVYTRTELKRELKRCVDLGKPWPFVLAVIPHSATKQKSFAPRIPFTLKGVFAWPSLAAPGRLVESPGTFDAAGYPIRTE
jgi:hypothetical protein